MHPAPCIMKKNCNATTKIIACHSWIKTSLLHDCCSLFCQYASNLKLICWHFPDWRMVGCLLQHGNQENQTSHMFFEVSFEFQLNFLSLWMHQKGCSSFQKDTSVFCFFNGNICCSLRCCVNVSGLMNFFHSSFCATSWALISWSCFGVCSLWYESNILWFSIVGKHVIKIWIYTMWSSNF